MYIFQETKTAYCISSELAKLHPIFHNLGFGCPLRLPQSPGIAMCPGPSTSWV